MRSQNVSLQVSNIPSPFFSPFKYLHFILADKDYIPGPGEYDVGAEDGNRHKRYGFLTQSGRFSEGKKNNNISLALKKNAYK